MARARPPVDPLAFITAGLPSSGGDEPPPPPTKLHAKQIAFCNLPHLEALYGGAAGGGKTEALLADALERARRPKFRALLLRRTFRELMLPGSIMHRALEWVGREHWNDIEKRVTFPNGALWQFGYCDNVADLDRYKSAQFHAVYIDELTEWPEQWYTFLFSRIRRVLADKTPLVMRAATNPDGIGAEWVRRRFGIPEGDIIVDPIEDAPEDRIFLPARIEDNPALDIASYEKSLKKLGAIRYQQLRFGRWLRDGEGLVYQHFDDKRNVTDASPSALKCDYFLLGIDFGFVDATAFCILGWQKHSQTVYVLRCWKETGLTPSDVAERTRVLDESFHFQRIIGDSGGLGKGYTEEMRARWNIPIEPAAKENKRGYIDLLNGALHRGELVLCMPECEALRAEWVILPWDEGRQKESAGFDNHCADATLYSWRAATAFIEQPAPYVATTPVEIDAAETDRRRDVRRAELEKDDGWARWTRRDVGEGWGARHPTRRR